MHSQSKKHFLMILILLRKHKQKSKVIRLEQVTDNSKMDVEQKKTRFQQPIKVIRLEKYVQTQIQNMPLAVPKMQHLAADTWLRRRI